MTLKSQKHQRTDNVDRLSGLTLVAVRAGEPVLALAAELSSGVTPAPPVWAAHAGRNQTHPARRAVGRHRHRAAVNH